MTLTPEQLKAIRERAERARPEPIGADNGWHSYDPVALGKIARFDIPALLDEVEALKALVEKLQWGACETCGERYYCPICQHHRPFEDLTPEQNAKNGNGHAKDCPVGLALGSRPAEEGVSLEELEVIYRERVRKSLGLPPEEKG